MVIVTRRHEDDRLAVRGLDHLGDIRRDARASREHAEVDGLEMREQRVVALDHHHGLPRLDPVAVVQRVHGQLIPVAGAELEDRDRFVDTAEHRAPPLEDLHQHARMAPVGEKRRAGVVEVRVRVVAAGHPLGRKVEDLRREPFAPGPLLDGH